MDPTYVIGWPEKELSSLFLRVHVERERHGCQVPAELPAIYLVYQTFSLCVKYLKMSYVDYFRTLLVEKHRDHRAKVLLIDFAEIIEVDSRDLILALPFSVLNIGPQAARVEKFSKFTAYP